jgi:hypothetical protein
LRAPMSYRAIIGTFQTTFLHLRTVLLISSDGVRELGVFMIAAA